MRTKNFYIFLFIMLLIPMACNFANSEGKPPANTQQPFPTLDAPSETVIQKSASGMTLSNPNFNWTVTLPSDWTIAYDAGYQINANNPDQTIFVRLQAQRWKDESERLPDAKAYVDHWKNFSHGNVFPLFADGSQVSETEVSADKFGGPYLQYEFDSTVKQMRYLQVYASSGGPNSTMISTWTSSNEYDKNKKIMQDIIDSFELLENTQ